LVGYSLVAHENGLFGQVPVHAARQLVDVQVRVVYAHYGAGVGLLVVLAAVFAFTRVAWHPKLCRSCVHHHFEHLRVLLSSIRLICAISFFFLTYS
jgi:uncharacterized membrane protein YczE